ncbi:MULTISPECIES: polysaccharide pyruvyl transferase family protein [Cellvibrio]|uniref:Polysaccharide pyruvyl transferase WcaK-like protein n=1 Tax=Cellvibrio fibrivorans TaxID=126350 RepID=A0ABU1UW80_9GAMM|nr:polysaccharide pyruvyl transferase family protein [Cellvibrio fibrivorans]MDR7089421.1 polysaccharide pyruvyl transferase WcaK-like protein [Cellvibrio fibrivorans]
MKVLHVASFTGNIGDNANHSGMRSRLESVLDVKPTYTELEIRYCYRIYTGEHRWAFDEHFVALANEHDLVIVGGGNFFEPWLDESATATTINITNEHLQSIATPIMFYGVGFDIHKGCTPANLAKFSSFLAQCIRQPNVLISFRNDGSLKNLKLAYPDRSDLWAGVDIVPDGGFFYKGKSESASYLPEGRFWGVNIASDMEALRFPAGVDGGITWKEFLTQYARFLESSLAANPDLRIILFPHIFRDVLSIGEFMTYLDDRLCRDRIIVAPFACGWRACDHIFSLYQRCELVMGMRFHTNVCSIAMNIPAIPLISYPKLWDLYEEIGLLERAVYANRDSFVNDLTKVITAVVRSPGDVVSKNNEISKGFNRLSAEFFFKVKDLLP